MPERPKFDSQTLKRLLSYMRAYKGTLVLVTVCIPVSYTHLTLPTKWSV